MKFTIYYALLSWIVVIIISVPLFCTLCVFWIHQKLAGLHAKFYKPKLKSVVKDLDTTFAYDDFYHSPLAAVTLTCVIEGQIVPGDLRSRLGFLKDESWKRFTLLHTRMHLGCRFWAETPYSFCLSDHIINSYESVVGETELNGIHAKYLQSPFQYGKPLWDMLCLHNYFASSEDVDNSKSKTVLILRAHHVIADGLSMVKFVSYLSDDPPVANPETNGANKKKDGVLTNLRRALWVPLTQYQLLQDFGFHKDILVGQKSSTLVSIVTVQIPLGSFRKISQSFKSQVTSSSIPALTLIVSGVLRRILRSAGKEVNLKGATNTLVSLPLVKERHKNLSEVQIGNCWTSGLFKLPLNGNTIADRRRKIIKNTRYVEEIGLPNIYPMLVQIHSLSPPVLFAKLTTRPMGAPVGLSNIPGPSKKSFLFGQEILQQSFVLGTVWKHAAMSATFYSYAGTITVSIVINNEVLNIAGISPEKVMEYFHEEVEAILTHVDINAACKP